MGGVNATHVSKISSWKQHEGEGENTPNSGVRYDGNAMILARILSNARKGYYLMTLATARGDQRN